MKKSRVACALLLSFYLLAVHGRPVSAQARGGGIDVRADNLAVESGGNVIRAEGNVEIKRQDTVMKAQSVRVNKEEQEVEARGEVSITDPEWTMEADSVRMNLKDETGELLGAKIFIDRGHLNLTGERFEKFEGQAYQIKD
ncbi:MAG TPA: LptA/OstA family protein, partial [Candidatus Binatia bacterium]